MARDNGSPWGKRLGGAGVVLLASATALAGCGGSKASTSSPGTVAATPTTAAAAPPTTAAPTTAVSGATPPSVATTVAAGKGSDPGSTFCRSAVALQAQEQKEVNVLTDSPAQVKKFSEQSLAELPALEALAPSSIKAAITTVAEEDRALFADLAAAGYDYKKVGSKVTTLTENPKYIRADTTISSYLTRVCGISTS